MAHELEEKVHILLEHSEPVSIDACQDLMLKWVQTTNRSAPVSTAGLNDAHVLGMGIACVCCASLHDKNIEWQSELANVSDKILVPEIPLQQMSWTHINHLLTGLQIEFNGLFIVHEEQYVALVDMVTVLLMCMARLGFLLTHAWKPANDEPVLEDMENTVDVCTDGWRQIALPSIVQTMDAVHALYAGTTILVHANPLTKVYDAQPLHDYHREASLDTFYEISQIVDAPWGAVTQYAHNFVHLFHSVSQVVYYHYPNYNRRRQKPLADLDCDAPDNVHLLPQLLEQEPAIEVTFEHTGLGVLQHHAGAAWRWVVVGAHVLLADRAMQFWFGDARQLLAFALERGVHAPPP